MQNIKALGFVVSEKKIFKSFHLKIYFSLCGLYMPWTETIWTILQKGYIRNFPTKFSKIPASSLGGYVLEAINDYTRRTHTTDIQWSQ